MENNNRTKHHWSVISARRMVPQTPEEIWESAKSYFLFCDDNPIYRKGILKSGIKAGEQASEELPRVYSYVGLCLHTGLDEEYIKTTLESGDDTNEFYLVFRTIDNIIKANQFELAAVGELNPIFISKSMRLDSNDTPNKAVEVILKSGTPELSKSENEILEKLDFGQPD